MSQQSGVADLLGGFKPVDAQFVYFPLYKEFEDLFSRTFSKKVFIMFIWILGVVVVNGSICLLLYREI